MKFYSLFFIFIYFSHSLFSHEDTRFCEAQESLKNAFYGNYPYKEMIDALSKEGRKSILIFSYGSLMDPHSAARTLNQTSLNSLRPGFAFGLKRLFNRDVAIAPGSRWGVPEDPLARGMLNVMPTQLPQDFINGVLIDVDLEDMYNILFREEGYDLLPVIVQEWDCKIPPSYKIAHTFYAPPNKGFTNAAILPRPGYYELARDASLLHGQIFFRIWLKTTYVADGTTPITAWEKKVESGTEETRAIK